MHGTTNETESSETKKIDVAVVYSPPKGETELRVQKGTEWQSFYFITAISSSLEASDPKTAAVQEFKNATDLIRENYDDFWNKHVSEWETCWKSGNITIEGNLKLGQAINSSLYYITR